MTTYQVGIKYRMKICAKANVRGQFMTLVYGPIFDLESVRALTTTANEFDPGGADSLIFARSIAVFLHARDATLPECP